MALVLPTNDMIMTMVFSTKALVRNFLGVMSFSRQVLMASAACTHSRSLLGEDSGVEEEPGSNSAMDEIAVAISCVRKAMRVISIDASS